MYSLENRAQSSFKAASCTFFFSDFCFKRLLNNESLFLNILVFRPLHDQLQKKEKTNGGYKHNNKVSHGIFNLTFRMLQHTSSEVTVTKSDEI